MPDPQNSTNFTNVATRLLLTGGPTHEAIDAVRYLGNRSSGRVAIAIAEAAVARGWDVTLLLGPTALEPTSRTINIVRYTSCSDLQAALDAHLPATDVLIMAAAVSDYRPIAAHHEPNGKRRRDDDRISIELERTPDLLARCASLRRPDQLLVGFALEPRDQLLSSARDKLHRKDIDLIVANPLETMESSTIEAHLIARGQAKPIATTNGAITKNDFALWLLDHIASSLNSTSNTAHSSAPKDSHGAATS